ncbi:hypothetical protein Ahy_B06g083252 [Arachis hypogaea]|uniref:FAR1 domain-containing protein n=1 Tax=Arachis hypogaea TaxID=3818 RepID=A0A444YPP4_ARAHY|nr:hypothetical protein Ahy_B06g083252 [Arachis hypogaea]
MAASSFDESVAFLVSVYIITILVYCRNFSVYLQVQNFQLNEGELYYCFKSNQVVKCGLNLDNYVPKVRMNFNTLEDAAKFYKIFLKVADFFTRIRSTNKKGNKIKNQLIACSREKK